MASMEQRYDSSAVNRYVRVVHLEMSAQSSDRRGFIAKVSMHKIDGTGRDHLIWGPLPKGGRGAKRWVDRVDRSRPVEDERQCRMAIIPIGRMWRDQGGLLGERAKRPSSPTRARLSAVASRHHGCIALSK